MPIISNTSPIVILAKLRRLNLLKEIYGTVLLSPSVKVESIDKGRDLGAKDVREIEKGIEEEWIKLVKFNAREARDARKLVSEFRIGNGEAEALVFARNKGIIVILDDKEARAIAKGWGLDYTSTVLVLFEGFVKGLTSYDELVEDLNKAARVMWISTDVITELIKRARKVRK